MRPRLLVFGLGVAKASIVVGILVAIESGGSRHTERILEVRTADDDVMLTLPGNGCPMRPLARGEWNAHV